MKINCLKVSRPLLVLLLAGLLTSCDKQVEPAEQPGAEIPNTPATNIPEELVGTWYADHNAGPLTANWEQGTFQGEQGYREFRTMVFTKNGQDAVEYTTQTYNAGNEVKQYIFKITGTLEYTGSPATLTFHARSGRMRLFSNQSTGYQEAPVDLEYLQAYHSVLLQPQATGSTLDDTYMNARRPDGGNSYAVRYKKTDGSVISNPSDLYANPPATGTYVKIASQYYPTVVIDNQEWMSVNYAGAGGVKHATKPAYGTYLRYADLNKVPVPAGWRIPSKADYVKLLQSQGLELTDWGSTDGSDVASKKKLGQLMSATGWKKQDGYATNSSGFNAVASDYKVEGGTNTGEGYNCILWTTDRDADESPLAFQIIQMPTDTYANFSPHPTGYFPFQIPVRLVRDR